MIIAIERKAMKELGEVMSKEKSVKESRFKIAQRALCIMEDGLKYRNDCVTLIKYKGSEPNKYFIGKKIQDLRDEWDNVFSLMRDPDIHE